MLFAIRITAISVLLLTYAEVFFLLLPFFFFFFLMHEFIERYIRPEAFISHTHIEALAAFFPFTNITRFARFNRIISLVGNLLKLHLRYVPQNYLNIITLTDSRINFNLSFIALPSFICTISVIVEIVIFYFKAFSFFHAATRGLLGQMNFH
jgi:hypothetical protein